MAKRFVQKLPLLNYNGGRPPFSTDDFSKGYDVGSVWFFGLLQYKCTNSTIGAAVWGLVAGDGGLSDLTFEFLIVGDGTTTVFPLSHFLNNDYIHYNTKINSGSHGEVDENDIPILVTSNLNTVFYTFVTPPSVGVNYKVKITGRKIAGIETFRILINNTDFILKNSTEYVLTQ